MMAEVAAPIATYVEAYHAGDREKIGSVFTDDAVVTFNNMAPQVGLQAIKDSHVQAGRFRYEIDRSYSIGNVGVYEGQMYGVKNGEKVDSVPIAFGWVVEFSDDGQKIKDWRKYYDGNRVRMAMEAMKD
jgi:hypothetical protein